MPERTGGCPSRSQGCPLAQRLDRAPSRLVNCDWSVTGDSWTALMPGDGIEVWPFSIAVLKTVLV